MQVDKETIERAYSRLSTLTENATYADRLALKTLYKMALNKKYDVFTIVGGGGGGSRVLERLGPGVTDRSVEPLNSFRKPTIFERLKKWFSSY